MPYLGASALLVLFLTGESVDLAISLRKRRRKDREKETAREDRKADDDDDDGDVQDEQGGRVLTRRGGPVPARSLSWPRANEGDVTVACSIRYREF